MEKDEGRGCLSWQKLPYILSGKNQGVGQARHARLAMALMNGNLGSGGFWCGTGEMTVIINSLVTTCKDSKIDFEA